MQTKGSFLKYRFVTYEELVKMHFAFLVKDYELEFFKTQTVDDKYIVIKFFSKKVFVDFYYGAPSFQLDFCVGRLGIEDKPGKHGFTSFDLLCLENEDRYKDYKLDSAHSYDNLRKGVPKLAETLRLYGKGCLVGNTSTYEKLVFERKKRINIWSKKQELKQAKILVSEAWDSNDYEKVVKVFGPLADYLSPADMKRLEYARKRL